MLARLSATAVVFAAVLGWHTTTDAQLGTPRPSVSLAFIRSHMEFLASDALQGRGSETPEERIAATYIASMARHFGLEPAGDAGTFLQRVERPRDVRPAAGDAQAALPPPRVTWNVVARLPGRHRSRASQAILLSAHLDHVGKRGSSGDVIFNGADDDASGVTAVLELARVLAAGPRLDRTVYFAWFGAEETGGLGSRHFADHPPVPLDRVIANVQFEMIGRPDPAVPSGTLWLTGFGLSSLGPELARRGARLVADPHPSQNFFYRSDNIQLAYRGVVAHTVSSYGLHADYHTPADELSRIDFEHMRRVIDSLVRPLQSLANSSFVPAWKDGPPRRGGRGPS